MLPSDDSVPRSPKRFSKKNSLSRPGGQSSVGQSQQPAEDKARPISDLFYKKDEANDELKDDEMGIEVDIDEDDGIDSDVLPQTIVDNKKELKNQRVPSNPNRSKRGSTLERGQKAESSMDKGRPEQATPNRSSKSPDNGKSKKSNNFVLNNDKSIQFENDVSGIHDSINNESEPRASQQPANATEASSLPKGQAIP